MSNKSKFYAVGEKEVLTATSVDEAVQDYVDQCNSDGETPFAMVAVQGYIPSKITVAHFERSMTECIEFLDENFGNPDAPSNYEPSNKVKALFHVFAKQVAVEYPVWQCQANGPSLIVKVSDYADLS